MTDEVEIECNLTEEMKDDTTAHDACDWLGSWENENETSNWISVAATFRLARHVTRRCQWEVSS